ncbi:putative quinol monooxygenase [Mesonia aestuariivivens]|uniref:Antibiotic biosynthesis monooxygenase n=1 Tax=Mesonia aestuariivivens TaxID=2796128 RepID=A0ABS6VZR3_9FLAO|nr:antibiotic biosynthesis monooxygenase family protein [Mesonia aestuariivivens]MBW2961080.1 antibiotic biosynthesis monooxygenase [Mesonia aestuariivivens]
MLVRIVKMTFKQEEIENFKLLFDKKKHLIRGVEGCQFLELYQDQENKTIFFTYSYWENDKALQNYRHSNLFKEIWAATKIKFNARPEAWSVNKLVSLT